MPIYPYGQEGLVDLLEEYFGDATLKDFPGDCIAGAVARRFDASDKKTHDTLHIFDTKSVVSHSAISVMKV
jgi:patatin-like phospholipase/acyl hydrolase